MKKFIGMQFVLVSMVFVQAVFASEDEAIQKIQADAYEECAVRVFEKSTKVSDVFKECEAEMNVYISRHSDKTKDKIKQKIKVETRKALTEKTLSPPSEEG
jgi:hypothetical protein